MSTTMTFASLQDDVSRYLERGSSRPTDPMVFDQLPRLINLAERRIALELKIEGLINVVTTDLQPGVSVYAKPDRWRDTVSIGYRRPNGERQQVFPRGYEFLRAYWPDSEARGAPEYYADYDYKHWVVAPTPDAAYPAEILYYELPQPLSDAVQTNWITEYVPQLLLYATLLEASPFLKNDERIATWQAMYDRSAGMVNGEDLAKMLDRSSVRKEA